MTKSFNNQTTVNGPITSNGNKITNIGGQNGTRDKTSANAVPSIVIDEPKYIHNSVGNAHNSGNGNSISNGIVTGTANAPTTHTGQVNNGNSSKNQNIVNTVNVNSVNSNAPSSPTFISNRKKNLYKTEMCRSAEETGNCPYGAKCQFAHTPSELRVLDRHPRYKTEMCKTFWEHGTCPYGKRCCFRHSREGDEIVPAVGGAQNSSKGLGIQTQYQNNNNFTLHSPRSRTVSHNNFEAATKQNNQKLSPILAKLEINSQAHLRTSSVPLEISRNSNINELSSRPTPNMNEFSSNANVGSFGSLNFEGGARNFNSTVQPPLSAGLEVKKTWDSVPFLAPYSANNFALLSSNSNNVNAGPFSASATQAIYPWSVAEQNAENLEDHFGKLSVATSFSNDFRKNEFSSFSAMPFAEHAGLPSAAGNAVNTFPSTPERTSVLASSFSAFPESLHATSGFFPENSSSGRSLIMTEEVAVLGSKSPVFAKSPFRSTPPGINVARGDGYSTVIGSPLATSFGDDGFGSPFTEPPSSPLFHHRNANGANNNRVRGTLRDVWSSPLDNLDEGDQMSKNMEPLPTVIAMGKVVKLEVMDAQSSSILSPPTTPSNRT